MNSVRKKRVATILKKLTPLYGADPIEVHYETPFQLVVAVILSAQCTDKRVNQVTAGFFDRLCTPEDFLAVPLDELETLIKPTGFYRNKAKNILGAARMIVNEYGGRVPKTMTELIRIPGFGRKTANVILHEAYGINEGVVVDTHVLRLSSRLGLSREKTAEKVERDLMAVTPQASWGRISHLLILHGRRICLARRPACELCILRRICPCVTDTGDGFRKS
jgi:endonuclease-3